MSLSGQSQSLNGLEETHEVCVQKIQGFIRTDTPTPSRPSLPSPPPPSSVSSHTSFRHEGWGFIACGRGATRRCAGVEAVAKALWVADMMPSEPTCPPPPPLPPHTSRWHWPDRYATAIEGHGGAGVPGHSNECKRSCSFFYAAAISPFVLH